MRDALEHAVDVARHGAVDEPKRVAHEFAPLVGEQAPLDDQRPEMDIARPRDPIPLGERTEPSAGLGDRHVAPVEPADRVDKAVVIPWSRGRHPGQRARPTSTER